MRGERSRQASGGRGALTQHADEGVGQQVAVLVGGVALVHGPAADRSIAAFFPTGNFPILYYHELPFHHRVCWQGHRTRPEPVLATLEWDVSVPSPKTLMVSSYCKALHTSACDIMDLEADTNLMNL